MFQWIRVIRRCWFTLSVLFALMAAGPIVVPGAINAAKLYWWWNEPVETVEMRLQKYELEDPEELTDHHMQERTADDYRRAVDDAISADDAELARSILALAEERKVAIDTELVQRISAIPEENIAGDVWKGIKGEPDTPAGFAAMVAADLTVIGDARDLVYEAAKIPEQDNTVVALAATGIVATGAVVVTGGAATPVKLGVSVLKIAKRLGKLNAKLLANLVQHTSKAIRVDTLKDVARHAVRLNFEAAKTAGGRILDDAVLTELKFSGAALGNLAKAHGPKATLDSLELAESTKHLRRLDKLAAARGPGYRGLLKMTGGKLLKPVQRWHKVQKTYKRAEMAWSVFTGLMGWIVSSLAWAASLLWTTIKLVWRVVTFFGRLPAPVPVQSG